AGLVTGPLRSRFELTERLDYYPPEDLKTIIVRSAEILGVSLDNGAATEIAGRSRGTPRIANRLLRRVRDFAQVRADGIINEEVAKTALTVFEVDELGLDKVDAALLAALIHKFAGGPVGLSTLAIAVGEEPDTIEGVYEPYLLQLGLIRRTPRGRVATQAAFAHLHVPEPHGPAAARLFG
ncbi:MAG: holliday junction helicase RuvB, partial [Actinomycetota bacterium]|nr:holliday junction helicase RuvB [Actinomycetota bacterium]